MATANTPAKVATVIDGSSSSPSVQLIEKGKSTSPSPINSNKNTAPIMHSIIHEQEDIFIDLNTPKQTPAAAAQASAQAPIPINMNNDNQQKPQSVHAFNFKKRSKRSSSSNSTDARDRFKSRSISDSVPPISNGTISPSLKNYSLDMSNEFTQKLSIFTNDIKYLDSSSFINAMNWYYSQDLPPVEKMFPWLHGLHKYNIAQRRFLFQNIDENLNIDPYKVPAENVRFLTLIRSSAITSDPLNLATSGYMPNTGILKGTIDFEEILSPLQNQSDAKLKDSINSAFIMLGMTESDNLNRKIIFDDCQKLKLMPIFKELDPTTGVSLRNFHIQTSKISHISDFIVYCFNNVSQNHDSHCDCESIARLLRIAQLKYQRDHLEIPNGRYNTFILHDYDPFKDIGNLMSIRPMPLSEWGEPNSAFNTTIFNDWNNNTLYKEKLEIAKMSSATHVYRDVWFGNTTDFNAYHSQFTDTRENVSVEFSTISSQNSPPLYCTAGNTVTNLTSADFSNLESDVEKSRLLMNKAKANWKLFVNCYDGARFPSLSELREYLIHASDDYYESIYLEFPPSGSIAIGDIREDKIASIINLCKLLYFRCGGGIKESQNYSGLIYCSDGYSETSLLGLCYLMYAQGLTLDDAILKLHVEYGRPFFIFKTDYIFIQKIQKILLKYSPVQPGYQFNLNIDIIDKDIMLSLFVPKRIDKRVFFRILDESNRGFSNEYSDTDESDLSLNSDNDDDDDYGTDDADESKDSVCAPVFGSLPSRILPHLYLGSLNHANNLPLLNELGITKVVSVGEKLGWVSDYNFTTRLTESGCQIMDILDSRSSDPTIKNLCMIDSVMNISNINDDGIGTLTATIDDALAFIDDSYQKQEKILVHCQVGVSRSATVCIAEVMKRLNVSLIRAYLFVRVRRLNVIIQPNLKLTYELFKWEENVVKSRASMNKSSVVMKVPRTSVDSIGKDRSSFNSLFSNTMNSKNSISRSSMSTSITSTIGSLDNNIDNSFFSFRVKENNEDSLKSLTKTAVFISDEEIDEDEEDDDEGEDDDTESDRTFTSDQDDNVLYNGFITNNHNWLREVDWSVLCKEIYYLNRAYINHG